MTFDWDADSLTHFWNNAVAYAAAGGAVAIPINGGNNLPNAVDNIDLLRARPQGGTLAKVNPRSLASSSNFDLWFVDVVIYNNDPIPPVPWRLLVPFTSQPSRPLHPGPDRWVHALGHLSAIEYCHCMMDWKVG